MASKEHDKSTDLDSFTTRLDSELKEKVRAVAWYNRISQREIVEGALEDYFKKKVGGVDKMVKAFKKAGDN